MSDFDCAYSSEDMTTIHWVAPLGGPTLMVHDVVTHKTKGDVGVIHAIIGENGVFRAAVWWDHRDPSWPLVTDLTVIFE